jgi:predicted phosphate transport protein (TIGR00153 family)
MPGTTELTFVSTKEEDMGFSFLPKESNLFVLFKKQAQYAVEAAVLFVELTAKGTFDTETVQKMRDIEHQGDEIAHEIIERLNKTFITPFDREDIHALTTELDSVIDMIYTIANRMKVYKIVEIDADLVEFSTVIEKSVRALARAIEGLSDAKHPQVTLDACIEVNRLENIGDTMRDAILAKLFETVQDPIFLIKWKELYQFSETVLDICEDVAHIVESIIVKQA